MSLAARALRATARFMSSNSYRLEPSQASSLLDFGTRRPFNSEHDMLRETARRFFKEKKVPREIWQEAGKLGLLSVQVAEEYGGLGADIVSASAILEDALALDFRSTPEQKQKYLPGACNGNTIVAIAMTEPGAGSDLQGIKTTAVRDGDDYIINGQKTFISNGQLSDVVIVVARTNLAAKAAHGTTLFLVDTNTPGYSKGRNLKKLGLKAQDTSELFFDSVRVPASAVLGEVDKGFYQLMNELPQERLVIAGLGVAHAEACYEWTRTYIKERKAFGGTLSKLQTVRHKMAEIKTTIAVARAFYDRCLELHKDGKLTAEMASMAKYWCTDVENKVADECLQLHGGFGYMCVSIESTIGSSMHALWHHAAHVMSAAPTNAREYPISRAFADARVQRIYGGANEIMKELISRSI